MRVNTTTLYILANHFPLDNEVKLIDFNISKIIRPELFSPVELFSATSSTSKKKKNSFELSGNNNFMMTNTGIYIQP